MRAGRSIPHPASTGYYDGDPTALPPDEAPPAKRPRRLSSAASEISQSAQSSDENGTTSPRSITPAVPDSDGDESGMEDTVVATMHRPTELESALPPVAVDQAAIEEYESSQSSSHRDKKLFRSSIYVDAFNLALETTLQEESYLFCDKERAVFAAWTQLDYEAQFLYVRLFLRKTSVWHRVSRLAYHNDIANLPKAIEALLERRNLPDSSAVADVPVGLAPPEETIFAESFTFANTSDDMIHDLAEASELLSLDELKSLAKEAKVSGKNKAELLAAFRRASRQQTGLSWAGLRRTKSEDSETLDRSAGQLEGNAVKRSLSTSSTREDTNNDSDSAAAATQNRDNHFVRKILDITGPCVRLALAPLKLFERVHLVFYRSTEWTEKSLTTIILSKLSKRNFPSYIVSRSANIFPTRSDLLEFEAAIRTQDKVDKMLEGVPTAEDHEEILRLFEIVYPRWKSLKEIEQHKEDHVYDTGEGAYLRRFSPAWVYTRILHKATAVLGRLKLYEREYDLLTELLDQQLFHPSRRGAWYQRLALLEERYMAGQREVPGMTSEQQRRHWKKKALVTCERGLQDRDCHIIFHYDLQKRITKLEKHLRVVKREQHDFGHVRLGEPLVRVMEGTQVVREDDPASKRPAVLRTTWIDEREGNAECTVEEMCLSQYRDMGYKGYHCEGGVIRTIFAFLFYDILFLYIPNVFQTPFQSCPLDLHTDSFYPSRASEINRRLVDIANGAAPRLISDVDARERERQTCVVGLRWDYELDDLLEIVTCFDGESLATICKVLAQEYGRRGGGMPDLFLWHPERREVLFSEVKSENDRLSDTQRLWIHVLTGAGIKVELCNARSRKPTT